MSRIAVFHDNFAQMGGAERVAEEIYNLLSGAALHTTLMVPELLSEGLRQGKHPNYLDAAPARNQGLLSSLFPLVPASRRSCRPDEL